MTEKEMPESKSPYDMEITDSKRSTRSKILILSSGVAVGASMLVGTAFAINQDLTEDQLQVQEQVQDQTPDQVNPVTQPGGQTQESQAPVGQNTGTAKPQPAPAPSVDPQGMFTPGYAEDEESEHVGSDEDHPENLYHEDEDEDEDDEYEGSEYESGDDD